VSSLASQSSPPSSTQATSAAGEKLQFRVAVIAALSALLGALIGGGATLAGSIYQERSASAVQLQSERQNSYVAYNTTVQNFFNAGEQMLLDIRVGFQWQKALNNVGQVDIALGKAIDEVSLLASPSLFQVIKSQEHAPEIIDLELQQLAARVTYPKEPITSAVPAEATLLTNLSSGLLSFEREENSFEYVARSDLGTH
jgi:hypothetical protein